MNIKSVITSISIGSFVLRDDKSNNHIKMSWSVGKDILNDRLGRVYIITVDDIIVKFGGSTSKGGIRGTMSPYCNAMNGKPSIRTYGIQIFIKEELEKGSRVDIHLIKSKKVVVDVNGLFDSKKVSVAPFKEMENTIAQW